MSLSAKIMNMRETSANIGKAVESAMNIDNDWETRLAMAYRMGFKDARHEASEKAENVFTVKKELTDKESFSDWQKLAIEGNVYDALESWLDMNYPNYKYEARLRATAYATVEAFLEGWVLGKKEGFQEGFDCGTLGSFDVDNEV